MCGITGLIDFEKKSTTSDLKNMTDTLYHRGPDGDGYEFFTTPLAQVGLGHRRLSIIDLTENGKQPMQVAHLWITYNGEVYNYKEIRKELITLGHQFISESDTEVILNAYLRWGKECIHKLIGMFAFTIFDTQNNQIFLARDRTGVKPLFYYFSNDLFLFASELKAFHAHPNFAKKIDLSAVAAFMQYGNIPGETSIFHNTYKLKPGHYLTVDLEKKVFDVVQYWNVYDYYNQPKLSISFEEAKTHTERLITSASQYRMIADVPVGIFLSGGYDSSLVTALLQKNNIKKLKTYTIGVQDSVLNEAPYAAEIANYLGTDHTTYECTEKEAMEFIFDMPFYYDEPFADSSAIPTHLVSKIARKDVTVALSADGGDEVFAGYNRYQYLSQYGNTFQSIPSFIRHSIVQLMNVIPSQSLPILKNKYNFSDRYEKLKGILQNPSSQQIMLSLCQQFHSSQLDQFFINRVALPPNSYLSSELLSSNYSHLAYMMAIDYQTYLPDDILQKVDRATMSVSLEGREPLLDHRVLEWASQLPDNFKYSHGIKKHILREISHQYIPKSLLDRPKMGFSIPIGKWLLNDLRPVLEFYISQDKITSQGIFNWIYINKLKTNFLNGKLELSTKIWYLLMFQMWYERWMK